MALAILDGTQTATTLSTILSSGQHITAHTVVSLGTQAITDILNATSAGLTNTQLRASAVTIGGTVTVGNSLTISSLPAISGTVTANNTLVDSAGDVYPALGYSIGNGLATQVVGPDYNGAIIVNGLPAVPISGTVTANINTFPDATTIGEQIAQGFTNYGSFDVAISGTANVSGTVTAVNHQGTSVTTSNFTSTTASTVLASANTGREVLTIFNEGAGNLHICAGATCTTIAYQVRLSAGDYYEVPLNQTSLTHSAVFATAGTARVTEVS